MTERKEKNRIDECYIHIGTEKTGTSSVQRFFHLNRNALYDEGVLYTQSAGSEAQIGFVALIDDLYWKLRVTAGKAGVDNEQDLARYRQQLASDLDNEFAANSTCKKVIISSEHFHSRLKNIEQIQKLKQYLSGYVKAFRVVVYFRRQDKLAVSLYSTKVKSGAVNPVLFPLRKGQGLPYYFNYLNIYNNWASVFGHENVIVREYDDSMLVDNGLIDDICHLIGIDVTGKRIPDRVNLSLNDKGLCFLEEVNRQMPLVSGDVVDREREKLGQYISSIMQGNAIVASRSQAIEFYDHFRESNKKLNAILDKQGGPGLFDEDFASYPDTVNDIECRYEDAVSIAIGLWKLYREEFGRKNKMTSEISKKENFMDRILRRFNRD